MGKVKDSIWSRDFMMGNLQSDTRSAFKTVKTLRLAHLPSFTSSFSSCCAFGDVALSAVDARLLQLIYLRCVGCHAAFASLPSLGFGVLDHLLVAS